MTDPTSPAGGLPADSVLDLASAWVDGALTTPEFQQASADASVPELAESLARVRAGLGSGLDAAAPTVQRDAHLAAALAAFDAGFMSASPSASTTLYGVVTLDDLRERRARRLGRIGSAVAAAAVVALGVVAIASHGGRRSNQVAAPAAAPVANADSTATASSKAAGGSAGAVSTTLAGRVAPVAAAPALSDSANEAPTTTMSVFDTPSDLNPLVSSLLASKQAPPKQVCTKHPGTLLADLSWLGHPAELYIVPSAVASKPSEITVVDTATCADLATESLSP